MLALLRELLQLFLPRLVRLAAAGTKREEKYTPSAHRLFGVRPRHWGFFLVLAGLLVSLLEAAAGGAPTEQSRFPSSGRMKCAHLVGWGAALFSDPRAVTLVYFFRIPMAYVDYACRRGMVPPTGDLVARELFVTLVALVELWWRHWRFGWVALPSFARRIERAGEGDAADTQAKSLRKYTVMFRVSEHTTCSEVERFLQQAEGHFPQPRRWDKRRVCDDEWVFLEYEDVGTKHHGKEQLQCKVARHPSRKKMYAGVGLATMREIEETYRVDIPTDRIKLEPENVIFTIIGHSLADCEGAAQQLRGIAPRDSKAHHQIRRGNAFSRGKRAEDVLRRGGLHVAVREGGNHGGIADCIAAYKDALAKGSVWAASVPPLRRQSVEMQPVIRQKEGYDSVGAYRKLGGPPSRMLLNGTRVQVLAAREFEEVEWLEVQLQCSDDHEEEEVLFVKRHNVAGSLI